MADLDALSVAELKELAARALASRERNRERCRRYYAKHRETQKACALRRYHESRRSAGAGDVCNSTHQTRRVSNAFSRPSALAGARNKFSPPV